MKHNLLMKTTVAGAVIVALSACSGVEKGYDPEINAANPVEITQGESFTATLTEDSGIQSVNLVDGVQIGGANATDFGGTIKITQMEFTADQNFITPETDSNSSLVSSAKVSPFWLAEDGRSLIVDTDKFSESLRFCDNTDLRGGPQTDDGAPTPDGNLDFPNTVTYTISYEINNGYNYAPGTEIPRRTLQLQVNAATDPVNTIAIADVSVPSGGTVAAIAQTAPVYACNSAISYSIADTSVATVDADTGMVTGVARGTTTITATSVDGGHSETADVTVTAGFTLDITNGDIDELGALTGTKSIPECVRTGLVVEPTLHIEGESFTGDYTYDWMSSDDAIAVEHEVSRGFGGTAILSPANEGDTATLTAAYGSGYTAGVAAGEIDAKTVDVTVVNNIACDTENPVDATPFDFSNGFESDTMINGVHIKVSEANGSTRWIPTGSMSSVSPALGEGFGGSNAMKITVVDADNGGADVPPNGGIGTLLQRWNASTGSWTASNFGQPTSIGKTFEFSVWVKLSSLAEEGQERTITNFMFPWKTADDATYHSIPEYNSWGRRYAPFNMQLTKTLVNTTEWQLVELGEYTIPEDWSGLPQPIKYNFHFEGGFANGDEILLEDLAVVEK